MKYFRVFLLIFILTSCNSSDYHTFPYDPRCVEFGGLYKIVSMTSLGAPIDLDGDGIAAHDLFSEITANEFYHFEYNSNYAVAIPQNEHQKKNTNSWASSPRISFRVPVQITGKFSDDRYTVFSYQDWFNLYEYGFSDEGELWAHESPPSNPPFSEVKNSDYGELISIKRTGEETFSAQFRVRYLDLLKNEFVIIPIEVNYQRMQK